MSKFIVYKGYEEDAPPPKIPKPDVAPDPKIVTVQEGIPILFPPCEGPAVRVLHPTNPNAPSQNFSITQLYMPPHTVLPTGSHEPEECYVILQGEGEMTFAHYTREVKAGDFIYLPPWCVHGLENTGTEMLIVLVCTSPTNP
ncbi:MAG: cupin domain-containing protein [Candidatus Poribacteria bacterium]|nr:cupin domain-containing protein [Candidatus Poribacteria bacterium]